jgi:hypothetical protein
MSILSSIKNIFSSASKIKETLEDVRIFVEALKTDEHLKGVLVQIQTTESVVMKLRLIVAYLLTKVDDETKAFTLARQDVTEKQRVLNIQSDTINDLRKEVEEKTENLTNWKRKLRKWVKSLTNLRQNPKSPRLPK